jgi:hypothetical protein
MSGIYLYIGLSLLLSLKDSSDKEIETLFEYFDILVTIMFYLAILFFGLYFTGKGIGIFFEWFGSVLI